MDSGSWGLELSPIPSSGALLWATGLESGFPRAPALVTQEMTLCRPYSWVRSSELSDITLCFHCTLQVKQL